MSDPQSLLYRMMGGVAGAMDQVDSNTLSRLPSGQYGYMPSRRHLDHMNQIMQPSMQNSGYSFAAPRQQVMSAQPEEDKMDISKYIGKNKLQQQKPQPNSQLELLKTALEPINEQLEKICILLGMIYQSLDKEEEVQNYVAPVANMEVSEDIGTNGLSPEEEIAQLERKIDSRPKAPSTEELGVINDDLEIEE